MAVDIKTLPKEKQKEVLARQLPKKLTWYALCVNALHEKKIRDAINERGQMLFDTQQLDYQIRAWVPIKQEKHKWSDRVKTVDVLQIPGIVFVFLKQADKQQIYIDPHIKSFLFNKQTRAAEPIPSQVMDPFIEQFDSGADVDISMEEPQVGEKVKMLTGSMKGIVGRMVRKEGKNRFRIRFSEFTFSFVVDRDKFVKVKEEVESEPIYVRLEEENEIKVTKPEASASMMSMDQFEAKPYKEANAKFHRERKKELEKKTKKEEEQ